MRSRKWRSAGASPARRVPYRTFEDAAHPFVDEVTRFVNAEGAHKESACAARSEYTKARMTRFAIPDGVLRCAALRSTLVVVAALTLGAFAASSSAQESASTASSASESVSISASASAAEATS